MFYNYLPQSYKKYEITATFKWKICCNLNKKARLRQIPLNVTPESEISRGLLLPSVRYSNGTIYIKVNTRYRLASLLKSANLNFFSFLTRKQGYCLVKFTRKQDYLGCKDTKNIVSRIIMSRYFARNGVKKSFRAE